MHWAVPPKGVDPIAWNLDERAVHLDSRRATDETLLLILLRALTYHASPSPTHSPTPTPTTTTTAALQAQPQQMLHPLPSLNTIATLRGGREVHHAKVQQHYRSGSSWLREDDPGRSHVEAESHGPPHRPAHQTPDQ